ncbi:MAG TPA: class I SAM-dependent methyltransferase [Stellaceae bacterium]|nr:class I SAM-dependent methyltransferase [Stellaceae bacterium]
MSGFSLDWLRLRVPFDRAARDMGLARRFAAALRCSGDRPLRLVDLAAGTGANARALAPVIGGDQDWLLVDDDDTLLGFCAAEHIAWAAREGWRVEKAGEAVVIHAAAGRWRFAARHIDLARDPGLALADAPDGLALSAFADLVSAAWIDALASAIERRRVPLLSALAVDGRRQWQPPDEADAMLHEAFARHQRRDKGFGPALAGAATIYLGARLAAAGCAVSTAASDWRVGPEQSAMLAAVIEAERRAASEERPDLGATFAQWAERRRGRLAAGALSLTIGHRDLLALPRGA